MLSFSMHHMDNAERRFAAHKKEKKRTASNFSFAIFHREWEVYFNSVVCKQFEEL